jgi:hypothetical protein
MLRLLALTLVLICGAVYASEISIQKQEQPTEADKNTKHNQPEAKNNPLVINVNSADPAKDASGDEQTHELEHSHIEHRIAEGTIALACITGVLAVATIVLAAFTYGLWRDTAKLVIGAEDTAKRQLRAYVDINRGEIFDPLDPVKRRAFVEVKNYGETPANSKTMWVNVVAREWPLNSVLDDPPKNFSLGKAPLPPDRTSAIEVPIQFCGKIEEQLLSDAMAVYVYGQIRYTDIFGDKQITNFRLTCRSEWFAKGLLAPDTEGNDAT